MATLLGIDIGTTHCKVGLFEADGTLLQSTARPTIYNPEALWSTVAEAIAETTQGFTPAVVGIASMAETGLLVDRSTGAARSPLLAWHDRCAEAQVANLAQRNDALARFCRSGLRANAKSGLAKLLWLREQGADFSGAVWLSTADFIALQLTGLLATDPTLAVRTFAYDMVADAWDEPWLAQLGLDAKLFPPTLPSGVPVGVTHSPIAGLKTGTPVAISGHDHVCAAFAADVIEPGAVFDSMGTAETLIGALKSRPLDECDFASGFLFGPHVAPKRMFWMSSLPASGGSVEWLRGILGEERLSYAQLATLLEEAGPEPTGILYYPYLSGAGAPHADSNARAAFVGLRSGHTRAQFAKAVYEGTAYEMETIRRRAQEVLGIEMHTLIAAGGGTRNAAWLQIKADVCGCPITVLPHADATLWGAAMLAGRRSGILDAGILDAGSPSAARTQVHPDSERHQRYRELYEKGYVQCYKN
ncbi:MAG: ROK family protein [Anaerolineae bacterium]|nr:ROK family protein [Anaerolineae bacterium]